MNDLGQLLLDFRKRSGMSQDKIGFLIDVDPSHVSRIELGERAPSIQVLKELADIYDLSTAERLDVIAAYGYPIQITDFQLFAMYVSENRALQTQNRQLRERLRKRSKEVQTKSLFDPSYY